jgi:hypothetical protein
VNEDQLCAIFADHIRLNSQFRGWVLSQTKFHHLALEAILLSDEQAKRPAKAWWRHWWTTVKENNRQSETDIFLVFEHASCRFALHIENKFTAPISENQAADYRIRAEQMKLNKWVPYVDFETMIIAPKAYLLKNVEQCKKFDRSLSYEEIGEHVEIFANILGAYP